MACTNNWFGDNCMYGCNCAVGIVCDKMGNCPGNKCATHYFGPACQFYDRVAGSSVISTESYIKDHNIATCNPFPAATSIQVTLIAAFLFVWFRIEVKDQRNLLKFKVQLNTGKICSSERKFPGNRFVDVTCDTKYASRYLQIIGPISPDVCSVYISGGRNVALRQNTTQSSTLSGAWAALAVDNNKNPDYFAGSCTHTNWKHVSPWWTITYNRPQYLLSLYIFNRDGPQHRLVGFNLQAFAEDGSTVFQYTADLHALLGYYEVLGSLTSPIKEMKITGYTHLNPYDRVLSLCEVETFGETVCPEGTFGLWCGEKCQCQGNEVCNPVTGVCARGCQPGFYGFNCLSPCSKFCLDGLCTNGLGKCLLCSPGKLGDFCENDCQNGFYGFNCSAPCSALCVDDLCTASNGMCYHCAEGYRGTYCLDACRRHYYGKDCSLLCMKSCKFGLCTHQEGKCLQCYPGYQGDFCEEECRDGFFGDQCASECPTSCADVCDHVTGNCTCIEDFVGEACSDCVAERYGENCTDNCHIMCSGSECNRTTGECFSCDVPYSGTFCKDCAAGKYGENCTEKCSSMCVGNKCNRTTGECFLCGEKYGGRFCEVKLETALQAVFEHWWIAIVIMAGLTLAIFATIILCQSKLRQSSEE